MDKNCEIANFAPVKRAQNAPKKVLPMSRGILVGFPIQKVNETLAFPDHKRSEVGREPAISVFTSGGFLC